MHNGRSLSVGAKGKTRAMALQQGLHLRRVEDERALKRISNVTKRATVEQVARSVLNRLLFMNSGLNSEV